MKLENQVCSYDLANQLKELGVKQDGLYSWEKSRHDKQHYLFEKKDAADGPSAFTIAELGEMLPDHFSSIRDINNKWIWISPRKLEYAIEGMQTKTDTEADCRAIILITLIKRKIVMVHRADK